MTIPNTAGHFLQTSKHEMKDARKREVDFSVRPKDQIIEIEID